MNEFTCIVCQLHVHVVYPEVGCEGVGQSHVAGEGTEYEIPHLDAVWGNHVAERVVIVTQELWEVVQQNQQHPQRTLQQRRMNTHIV